jgi:hypothetical protein
MLSILTGESGLQVRPPSNSLHSVNVWVGDFSFPFVTKLVYEGLLAFAS